MKKKSEEIQYEFLKSFISLCMTKEIMEIFGTPLTRDNFCIHNKHPKKVCRVIQYLGRNTEIEVDGDIGQVEPNDLIWLPTAEEIRQKFCIAKDDGFWHGYKNFVADPAHYGYSLEELDRFPSEEERWLLYCMVVKRGKRFKNNEWLPFNYQ